MNISNVKKFMLKIGILLSACFFPYNQLVAQTASEQLDQKNIKYLSGPATIQMHAGNNAKYKTVIKIPIGSKLEIIKTENKFSLARTKDGTEGWINNLFLTETSMDSHKIMADNKILSVDLAKLRNQLQELEIENQRIRQAAEHPLKISDENSILVRDNVTLETNNDMLNQELQMTRDSSEKQWFLMGIGTILFGMLIGLLLPKLRRRRKNDWSTL